MLPDAIFVVYRNLIHHDSYTHLFVVYRLLRFLLIRLEGTVCDSIWARFYHTLFDLSIYLIYGGRFHVHVTLRYGTVDLRCCCLRCSLRFVVTFPIDIQLT